MNNELGAALRAARKASDIVQVRVIAETGISQAQLSRIENGRALPSEDATVALATLYRLPESEIARLVDLTREARAAVRDERLVIQRGSTLAQQQRWRAMESEAPMVHSYQPAVVLGVLQSARYAATVFGQSPDSDVVQDRMARHRAFHTSGRRLVAIQTEGALRRTVGSAQVMAEQMAWLDEVSRYPTIMLGVIPDHVPASFAVSAAFHIYDHNPAVPGSVDRVVVGMDISAATFDADSDVAYFRDQFARLERLAVFGDEARSELRRVAELYR